MSPQRPQVNTGEEEDQRLGLLQQWSEWNWTQQVRGRLIVEKEKQERRKNERKKEEPVSLSELNKLTLHPMQTWEMGFSLEMNRLGDNDADDCFLFLTFHVVSWRPCCVYHQQTCILKSQLFSGYCCQHLCKSRKLHKLLPQQNVCMLEPLCRWICRSWGTMRKLRNVLLALSVFLNTFF